MKTTIARHVSVIALASSVSAQSPFEANWTLNQEKRNFTATTMAIEDAASGAIKFVKPAFTYTVKIDGTKTDTPPALWWRSRSRPTAVTTKPMVQRKRTEPVGLEALRERQHVHRP